MISTELRFNQDMRNIYDSAKKLGYTATRFHQMIYQVGGYNAAKKLIHSDVVSDGITRLWEFGRLDLSVEAHVLKPEYKDLFTEEEREMCKTRLAEYGYVVTH